MNALILAGGSGTRFWPLSRRRRPKQLLALDGPESLLRRTVTRLDPAVSPDAVWVCTTEGLLDAVREELPEIPRDRVLAEPEGRNTAPAIAWAVSSMPAEIREEVVVVLPADHRIEDGASFRRCLARAAEIAASEDLVVTLGITPRWPETGYGYLELGGAVEAAGSAPEARRVVRFTEKPSLADARAFVEAGRYLWNAGIFVFRGDELLRRVREVLPELSEGLEAIAASPGSLSEIYPTLPRVSIDSGVMEKLDDLVTLPLDAGWSDLGSWTSLADALEADPDGNVIRGDVVDLDCEECLLWSDEGTVAAVGLRGVVVVRTGDAVLVLPKGRSQAVREIVDTLHRNRRDELL